MGKKTVYSPAVDKGEIIYKEWLAEKRDGYDLIVFANVKKEFLTDKLKGSVDSLDAVLELEQFVMDLAKEKEVGKYFHNTKGIAYGAAYKKHGTGELEIKHPEYWINGRRLLEESEIKKIIHDSAFNEKADALING